MEHGCSTNVKIIKVDIMSEKSLLGLSWARAFTTEKIQVPNATAIRQ